MSITCGGGCRLLWVFSAFCVLRHRPQLLQERAPWDPRVCSRGRGGTHTSGNEAAPTRPGGYSLVSGRVRRCVGYLCVWFQRRNSGPLRSR